MTILFLTNNLDVTLSLFEWIKQEEGDNNVILCSEKIMADFFSDYGKFCTVDYIISYNYLHVIGKDVITLFPHRIINLHISFLPWNKGKSPNIWSFIEGTPTGVTIHEIDEGVDTGDILLQKEIIFDFETETLKSSYEKSHLLMKSLFCENWENLRNGRVSPKPQNKKAGTKHLAKDSLMFEDILDYSDTVSDFLSKYIALTEGR